MGQLDRVLAIINSCPKVMWHVGLENPPQQLELRLKGKSANAIGGIRLVRNVKLGFGNLSDIYQ